MDWNYLPMKEKRKQEYKEKTLYNKVQKLPVMVGKIHCWKNPSSKPDSKSLSSTGDGFAAGKMDMLVFVASITLRKRTKNDL